MPSCFLKVDQASFSFLILIEDLLELMSGVQKSVRPTFLDSGETLITGFFRFALVSTGVCMSGIVESFSMLSGAPSEFCVEARVASDSSGVV